jgi:hypothetical protein
MEAEMGTRRRSAPVWSARGRRQTIHRLRSPNDWIAVVEQHHRMVQALTMAAPVHPPRPADRPSEKHALERASA